ncbi:MAG: Lpg1974 family pore-forming outer membrane protein [Simkaniaceae bacterium]|nr:Lpg1974 family pore-forming outer membrane protein [Simkaniaceae bacterium]
MEASPEGTEYCYTDQDNTASTYPLKGQVKENKLDWDWGLTVGVGAGLQHDGWDLQLNYTYFRNAHSSSAAGGRQGSVVATRGTPRLNANNAGVQLINVNEARSSLKFTYSDLTLELGRDYFVSGRLQVRTFYSLEAQWLKLNQDIQYIGGDLLGVNSTFVEDRCKFWGLGPRTGINTKWHLGYDFSIFGDVDVSLLYAHFDVSHKENAGADPINNAIRLSGDTNRFVPEVHYELGLSYDRYFDDNRHHIGVKLGYTADYMWGVNQYIYNFDNSTNRYGRMTENLGMQGAKLTVRWDF